MNKIMSLILIAFMALVISSCQEQVAERADAVPKVQVKVTQVVQGSIPEYMVLSGKTIYLNKSRIVAPIGGYLTSVNVQAGDRVKKGDLLFEMQSPEAYLMQKKDGDAKNYGYRKIFAPTTGIITSLNVVHQEVFIDKGGEMCKIIDSKDLKIQAELPYEYRALAKLGMSCQVVLPDSSVFDGVFTKILPEINEASQTVKILANISNATFLPENMLLKVMVEKGEKHQTQILPRECLLTDALMTQFWVMKLKNDTTAIRVDVKPGNQSHRLVEILSPIFNEHDRILSQGAYGLGNTALVEVVGLRL